MDFCLNEQQRMMQSSARRFFESLGGIKLARQFLGGDRSGVDSVWRGFADLEYLALHVPEQFGGLDLGPVYMAPVLEEAGRVLAPGPIAETCLFAACLISGSSNKGREDWLRGIVDGKYRFALCLQDGSSEDQSPVTSGGGELHLCEKSAVVWHVTECNSYLVVDATNDGHLQGSVWAIPADRAGVTVTSRYGMDLTCGVGEIAFDNVILGDQELVVRDRHILQHALDLMAIGLCCLSVGGMERLVEMSAEHAKTRIQFGQPVGRFQAVKHRIVEMKVRLDTARSLTYYAAWCWEAGRPEAAAAVSAAKAFCSEAYVQSALDNILNLGGMGYSYEHDAHLYLRRAKVFETYLGSAAHHRKRLTEILRTNPEMLEDRVTAPAAANAVAGSAQNAG